MSSDREDLQEQLARAEAEIARLRRREQHFVAAQRISHVGSYDFDIASNTNDWSDQLYRIYGREPGSFMPTYERFLEMVHPEDREAIVAVHQKALAELSTYEMEERVLWPDGSLHTLASWGEVVPDEQGRPARMVGICWDITEQQATAEALKRSSERLEQLIESAPDVVLVTDEHGQVLQANQRLTTVLGWAPDDLVGRPVTELLPDGLVHGETVARHRSGSDVPVDISTSSVSADRSLMTAAFLRDITDRQHAEALALTLHDNEVRRRHALEINDNVVQGLVSTLYLLDLGRTVDAHTAARNTLSAARTMMSDLLGDAGADAGQLQGQLVREQAHIGTLERQRTDETAPVPGALRVLLADDAEDIRLLLRLNLSSADGFEVVGEAGDGAQAVTLTAELRPDVVVLDLSMPVMDGLQAIPEMLRVCPTVRIVVLSGFDEQRLRAAAMSRGAHAYLEKGQAFTTVVDELNRLFPDRTPAQPPVRSQDMDSAASPVFDGDMVVHELRTPLTVVTGMLATLRDRMDELPSATTAELVQSALRNAQQMADLLDVLSDAGHASHGYLPVMLERTDVGPLVRAAVADLCSAHGWATVPVQAADGILADVDPVRCRQVLANLLGNAVKFGISATVTVQLRGDLVEVAVSDDGPGIPADRRPNLFRKFSRLGASGPGMGLGLFISRALARAQGGDVELRDGPRTTFVLSLPVSDVTASSSATGSR